MRARTKKAPPRPDVAPEAPRDVSPQLSLLSRLEAGESLSTTARVESLSGLAAAFGWQVGARASRVFQMIGIGEEILAERWPGKRREPRGAFLLLCVTAPVRISDLLYRAHAEEIVSRLPDGEIGRGDWGPLGLLTRAEVLGLLVEASLRHPLGHDVACLYEHLFVELFPTAHLPGDALLAGASPTKLVEVRRLRAEWLSRESPERAETVRKLRTEAA